MVLSLSASELPSRLGWGGRVIPPARGDMEWLVSQTELQHTRHRWAVPPVRLGLSGRNSGKFPERPRKRSQSVSWNSPREYGWDAPNTLIQGIWRLQSISRIVSPTVRLGTLLFQKWFRRGPLRAGHGIPSSTGGISESRYTGHRIAKPLENAIACFLEELSPSGPKARIRLSPSPKSLLGPCGPRVRKVRKKVWEKVRKVLGGHFGPEKKYLAPLPPNSPIRRRPSRPLGPSRPETPPLLGFHKKEQGSEKIRTRSTTTRDRNLQFRGAVSTGFKFFKYSPVDFPLFSRSTV